MGESAYPRRGAAGRRHAQIARWGVNAASLGAHDAGLACLRFQRDAGLRFLAAAAVCALALWPYT